MSNRIAFVLACFTLLIGSARADVITDWNTEMLDAIRATNTNPPRASRIMAMTHIGQYDAINAIAPIGDPYLQNLNINVPAATSREAAAARAGRDLLLSFFPTRSAQIEARYNAHLAAIPDGPNETAGINVGSQVASAMLAARLNDGSATAQSAYTLSNIPGRWEPTPPGNVNPPLLPGWGNVTPFAMSSGAQFRSPAPPALTSQEYTDAFNEVKALGAATGSTRTADQSNIAQFWADGGGTSTPPGHWNRIAQTVSQSQGLDLGENARMFALMNIAMADAGISAWDTKYVYDYWRPVTAIREADTDGNAATTQDAAWSSFIGTPPFPAYTSGHSTFSGAAAAVLARLLGDNVTFTTSAEGFVLADRTYTSFSAAANDAMNSRLYGGIHWRFDNEAGLVAGTGIGHLVASTQLVPEPSSLALVGMALAVGGWTLRRGRRAA